MKTTILLITTMALAMAPLQSRAGDKEWGTVGKVLTGVFALKFLDSAINGPRHHHHHGVYYSHGHQHVPVVTHQHVTVVQPQPVCETVVVEQPVKKIRKKKVVSHVTTTYSSPIRYSRYRHTHISPSGVVHSHSHSPDLFHHGLGH